MGRHFERIERPEQLRHYVRVERGRLQKTIRTVDPPFEQVVLLDAREDRQPGRARIEQLAVAQGDTITIWQGREPATMRLECGFSTVWLPGAGDVEDQIGFFHRLTGGGQSDGNKVQTGRRIALNFGHGQDHTWWVENIEISHKSRNEAGRTISFIAVLDLVQATAPVLALSPAEVAAKTTG
ncbi:hypothetical protein [Stomatohabitans albus]|uniref:hypothetical protein n=1 Tax=Stomatohabitans albus TaxID=3110766 RepID=UPI00300CD26B